MTQCHLLGLWDLNTQNQYVADRMQDFLKTAVADGVDGFRFDAAKHVELPTEVFDNKTSNYWNTILNNGSQFQYGEVLQGDSGLDYKAYADLFANNSSDGGGNTASNYGKSVRAAISSGNLSTKMVKNIDTGGAKEDQLVTWVESHDNYANGDKESTCLTDDQIMIGWAIVGSRRAGAPLYFNRPNGSGGPTRSSPSSPSWVMPATTCGRTSPSWQSTTSVTPWTARAKTCRTDRNNATSPA